jgi:hypothetical protein
MTDSPNSPPTVFISYSHDSREHKQWVAQLAAALMENHVQVIFDQWDLEPGDDVPKFMERAVKAADRVLLVCTEPYVRKANDGKGGVGYEAMIVTGELVRDLGTRKFIPIIRQGSGDAVVPDCVGTRLWVDFGKDEEFDAALSDLVKTLHQAQHLAKPTLGPDPFAGLRTPAGETRARQVVAETDFASVIDDAGAAYRLAGSIAASGDTATWRKLLRTLQRRATEKLKEWRTADEALPTFSEKDPSPLFDHAAQGVSFYMPLFACLVAGAESGREEFSGQLGWIDELINPVDWNRGGYRYWTDFPQLLLFVGQALVGGMLMEARNSDAASSLATTRIQDRHRPNESKSLFLDSGVTGWPESMNHTCTRAWGFLTRLIHDHEWIKESFGSEEHARAAVSAYYHLLSFLNFCYLSVNGRFNQGELDWAATVPLNFCLWPEDDARKGYQLFISHREVLSKLLAANGLEEDARFRQHWGQWMEVCGKWLGKVFQWHFRRDLAQINLPADLQVKGLSLAKP